MYNVTCEVTNKETCVTIGKLTIWFSYKTPVAYQLSGELRRVRENEWGPTTGKLINRLGPKESRLTGAEFERELQGVLTRHGLV